MTNQRIPFTESYYTARSDNGEWYTPLDVVERVRRALGGTIDLDPFSCDVAQDIVQATHYFTRERDAMLYDWPVGHTLFANPPYGRGIIGKCVTKIVREFPHTWHTGIILVNNATDTGVVSSVGEDEQRGVHLSTAHPIHTAPRRHRRPEHTRSNRSVHRQRPRFVYRFVLRCGAYRILLKLHLTRVYLCDNIRTYQNRHR